MPSLLKYILKIYATVTITLIIIATLIYLSFNFIEIAREGGESLWMILRELPLIINLLFPPIVLCSLSITNYILHRYNIYSFLNLNGVNSSLYINLVLIIATLVFTLIHLFISIHIRGEITSILRYHYFTYVKENGKIEVTTTNNIFSFKIGSYNIPQLVSIISKDKEKKNLEENKKEKWLKISYGILPLFLIALFILKPEKLKAMLYKSLAVDIFILFYEWIIYSFVVNLVFIGDKALLTLLVLPVICNLFLIVIFLFIRRITTET